MAAGSDEACFAETRTGRRFYIAIAPRSSPAFRRIRNGHVLHSPVPWKNPGCFVASAPTTDVRAMPLVHVLPFRLSVTWLPSATPNALLICVKPNAVYHGDLPPQFAIQLLITPEQKKTARQYWRRVRNATMPRTALRAPVHRGLSSEPQAVLVDLTHNQQLAHAGHLTLVVWAVVGHSDDFKVSLVGYLEDGTVERRVCMHMFSHKTFCKCADAEPSV